MPQKLETGTLEQSLEDALATGKAARMASEGYADEGLEKPDITARYDIAPAFHATLETASATARLRDGKLELWIASQSPAHARNAVAAALSMSERDIIVYPMAAGGSFDRRLEHDHAVEAALIAQAIGRPVQLIWTRWQDMLMDRPRTPAAADMSALLLPDGNIASWHARIACPATSREFGRRLFGGESSWDAMEASDGEYDPLAIEGAIPVYAITNLAIDHVPASIGLPTGRMRGNAHGYTAFFNESFIDEIAFKHHREPLSFRMQMLDKDLRLAACLQRAAQLAEWGGGGDQSGQGLACHRIGEGRIAAVATATRSPNGIIVSRIAAAVDIGRIVNIDIARQQIEGGLLFGIDLALGAGADYADGLPVQTGLASLGLPKLAEAPDISVEFIASEADPADPGELGVAVAGPVLANALFSATGLRFRRLPLLSGGI